MSRYFLVFLLIFFIFSGCYPQKQNSFIGAAIKENNLAEIIDPYIKDFGRIKKEEVVSHSFVIGNDSKETLNIQGVFTSCGCTTSEIKNKTLKPGESTILEVKFNSKGYSGVVSQFVYVNTDSRDNPTIRYTIKAEVIK